jgi:prefoldin subunit 5
VNSGRKGLNLLVLLFVFALIAIGWLKINSLSDWWKLRGYSPSAQIVQLVNQDTMTPVSRKFFYINHPQLLSNRQNFSAFCRIAEQTIVLGCYHSGENGIALYDVQDSRLQGIQEVTAAHETLHAAYDRLSPSDKQKINKQLQNFYDSGLNDQRIKETIALYKKTEPDAVLDEMHSIFGSEVANLPAPLESYYSRYFGNRQQIVAYSNNYEAVFTQNQNRLDSLSQQIQTLKKSLDAQRVQIDSVQNELTAQQQRMQTLLHDGQTDQYNAEVPGYNSRVSSLRAEIANYNTKIAQINSLVEQYNSLAYTQQSLYKSIDSRLGSQSTQ